MAIPRTLSTFDANEKGDKSTTERKKPPTEPVKGRMIEDKDPVNEEMEDANSDEDDESDDHASSHEDALSASDQESVSPDALAQLHTFISTLDPELKRKATDELAPQPKRPKRSMQERTEVGAEGSKLTLDDLLAPFPTHAEVRKATKALASSSGKAKTLDVPLPQRTQEGLDREAAYEQTKEEVEKWSETMKRIKEVCFFFISPELCRI